MKIITVTSPATDAGKTFIAASIAESASTHNIKTLFLDFDNPVGDSLRVFGLSSRMAYPTLSTWSAYSWQECLKTQAGTFILPKPNMLHEDIDALEIVNAAQDFDLIVADLGVDYRQKNWELLINRADLAVLVTDCDEKALVRVQSFIETMPLSKDFCLVVNSREKYSYYTDSQMVRELTDMVKCVVKLPHYPDAEKRIPKTLPENNPFNLELLSLVFSEIIPPEKNKHALSLNLPQIPKLNFKPNFKTPKTKTEKPKSLDNSEKANKVTAREVQVTKKVIVNKHDTGHFERNTEWEPVKISVVERDLPNILVLGSCSIEHDKRVQKTGIPDCAIACMSDINHVKYAPVELPLYIILSGNIGDWVVKKQCPGAIFCANVDEAIDLILNPKPVIKTTPIVLAPDNITNASVNSEIRLPYASSIYIISPSRPAYAGEVAASISENLNNCALVCASGESMGAKILGLSDRTLIKSDWRMVGSDAPIKHKNITVWPIDPYKHITSKGDVRKLVNDVKKYFSAVVVDCAGSFGMCARARHDEGIIVLSREDDASDQTTQYWIKTNGNNNTLIVNPNEYPVLVDTNEGITLSKATNTIHA